MTEVADTPLPIRNQRPSIEGLSAVTSALFPATDKAREQERRAMEIIVVRLNGRMPSTDDVRDYNNILAIIDGKAR